jgi:hypothetical protein
MTDAFQTRIPHLTDAELRRYVEHHRDYQTEAIEVVLAELDRRGLALSIDERAQILGDLEQRDATAQAQLQRSFVERLGLSLEARLARIRLITAGLLAVGLGSATAIYLLAVPKGANPLGYEPEDTKKYLRDLELYGGKVNVLATELTKWWEGLWHGRNLAYTVGWLTILLACAFWFIATRRARDLDAFWQEPSRDSSGPPGS